MAGRTYAAGDTVGGYAVVRALGAGGSGTVYLVRDGAGQVAALKSVDAHEDPVAAERLRREVAALQAVRHPAVPRIIDAELDGNDTFVVFEFIPGDSLADAVASRGPLAGTDLADMAERIAGALEAAHAAGVVHRDVTPANVMMSPDGAVLIDFGLSHRGDDERLTREGLVSGTAGYVAPEVIDGADPGPGADIWSWAATVAFAATGQAPFGTGNSAIRRTLAGKWRTPNIVGGEALRAAIVEQSGKRPGMRDVIAALRGATVVMGGQALAATALMPVDSDVTDVLDAEDDWDEQWDDSEETDGWDHEPWRDSERLVSDDFVLPASSEVGPAWEPSARRPVLVAAWTLAAAMIAAVAPMPAAAAIIFAALVARTAFVREDALRWVREIKGERRRDTFWHNVAMPWHVVKALGGLLPGAIIGGALGTATAAAGWQLVSGGVIAPHSEAGQQWGHALALAAGALVFAGALWWGLWSWATREGTYRVAEWFAPSRGVGAAWVVVAFVLIAVTCVAIDLGAKTWWWPLPDMPGSM